jgi:hypothetical protein
MSGRHPRAAGPGHIEPAFAKRVLGAKGPRAPKRYDSIWRYGSIWLIFDPSSDASPIKPFSPKTKARMGFCKVWVS